ncbi:MAG: 30S ribosomal protein S16, partial [Candidatus Latescibacteria bacterium]|nr:30S ribosomal protein S16 [Candidatus Latescibacterota bacterium]
MKRAGAKRRPFYRVVVADSRFARDGRYIEQLGYYDPLTDPAKFQIDAARFEQWIRRGARPSESVEVMMAKHAPGALRPAPAVLPLMPEAAESGETKPKKEKKARPAAKKTARKPKAAATKGSAKKAKSRAKAKAKKASGETKSKAGAKSKK